MARVSHADGCLTALSGGAPQAEEGLGSPPRFIARVWTVPDERLRGEVNAARPDDRPVVDMDAPEELLVSHDRLEDLASEQV